MSATWRIFADWEPVTGMAHAGTIPGFRSSILPRRRASRCWRWPTTCRLLNRRIRHEFCNYVRRLHTCSLRSSSANGFRRCISIQSRIRAMHRGHPTRRPRRRARGLRAGDAVPQDEHEDRRVQYPYYASICLSKLGFLPRLSKYSIVSLVNLHKLPSLASKFLFF